MSSQSSNSRDDGVCWYNTHLKNLHRDLERRYRLHGPKLERIWRSLGSKQRKDTLNETVAESEILKHRADRSLQILYDYVPEWNLRDLAQPDSDYVLDLLKHRAATPLFHQYMEGVNGSKGDMDFIKGKRDKQGLRHPNPDPRSLSVFTEGDYGKTYQHKSETKCRKQMDSMPLCVRWGLCMPWDVGELIMARQEWALQLMIFLVDEILDAGAMAEAQQKKRSKKPEKAARQALSMLSIDQTPEKPTLQDLAIRAFDQKSAFDDYLRLCRTEPAFLAHVVNMWFFTRPEMVYDDKGAVGQVMTDKYINIAVFEVIHNVVIQAAIWDYIYQSVQALVDGPNDRVYRDIILQNLSNVCDFEYRRSQKIFRRYVQMNSGLKYFKRISDAYDEGQARVKMKCKPEKVAPKDSQIYYMLRLCQPETAFPQAIELIRQLDHSHQKYPDEPGKLRSIELEGLGDLAVTIIFIQSLAKAVRLPSMNRKKGQAYVSGLNALGAEIDPLKTGLDVLDFAVPIETLEEPGMAQGALTTLDRYIVDKTGAEMGFLYQDLNESCLSALQEQYEQQKETNVRIQLETPIPEPPSPSARIEQRKGKTKSRPQHSSVFNITPTITEEIPEEPETAPSPVYKVKQATFEVFTTLFSSSESRGSIKWTAFEAAMTEMKFGVRPCFGSVFTFLPAEDSTDKPITFHRPHHSRIEGFYLLAFAKRLRRRFGWNEESFELV